MQLAVFTNTNWPNRSRCDWNDFFLLSNAKIGRRSTAINAEMMEMMNGESNRYISKIMDAAILIREQMDDFRDVHGGQRRRMKDVADKLDLDELKNDKELLEYILLLNQAASLHELNNMRRVKGVFREK